MTATQAFDRAVEQLVDADPTDRLPAQLAALRRLFLGNLNADLRFRIEIAGRDGGWEAQIFDHADHGPELMYAAVNAGAIEQVLASATHYVLVAAT